MSKQGLSQEDPAFLISTAISVQPYIIKTTYVQAGSLARGPCVLKQLMSKQGLSQEDPAFLISTAISVQPYIIKTISGQLRFLALIML
jgi:hypothetical protein